MVDFVDECHDLIGEGEQKETIIFELADFGMDPCDAAELYDEEWGELEDSLSDYLESEGLLENVFRKSIFSSSFLPSRRFRRL
jgi:hypothetical protein